MKSSKPSAGALALLVGPGRGSSPMKKMGMGMKKMSMDEPDDLTMAAEELISSIKSGDAAAVADAFKSMKTICDATYGDEE